jgi:hypothetical protein
MNPNVSDPQQKNEGKVNCRTISLNERPPSKDHRKANSCVRSISVSSNTSEMRLSLCGSSKVNRIRCTPTPSFS